LPSLKAFAKTGHILFGTDFPFAPADVAASFTTELDAFAGLTPDEHKAINHGNACTLFRRLALPRDTMKTVRSEMQQPASGTKFGSASKSKPATTVEE
jgi:hypothetical protein